MTDKVQKIRKEVVEIIHSTNPFIPDEDGKNSNYEAGKLDAATKILQIIDSLEEPVSEGLEEEVKKLWREINTGHEYAVLDSYDILYGICLDIANWQKEQMMAKAIDVEVKIDAGGYPYIPLIELYNYNKDMPLAKEGDKYKVILIKEE